MRRGQRPLAFELTRDAPDTLTLHADYAPGAAYTLAVAADAALRDGFGLPLLASEIDFEAAPLPPFFLPPGGGRASYYSYYGNAAHARFDAATCPAAWPALARGANPMCTAGGYNCPSGASGAARAAPQLLRHFAIGTQGGQLSIEEALAALNNDELELCKLPGCANAQTLAAPEGVAADALQVFAPPMCTACAPHAQCMHHASAMHCHALQALALPLPALQSGARLVLQRAYTQLSYSPPYAATASATRLLSSGRLGATVAATDDGQMAVWVVDTEANAPVEGAAVRVWGLERTWQLTASGVKQVASGISDADGLVLLTPRYRSGGLYSAYAVSVGASGAASSSTQIGEIGEIAAELAGEMVLLSDVPRPRVAPAAAPIVRLVSDRSYYRAGEEVHVKG